MARNSKDIDFLQTYLSYGIDILHRRIYLGYLEGSEENDIGFETITLAIRAIDKMLDFSNKPIEIHACSYGGDPYQSLALVDKILESPCQFKFYGRGAIMSAATVLMAVCDERFLSKNSIVMLHDGADGFEGKHTDLQIYAKEAERLQDVYNQIYADNSKLKIDFWENIIRRDLYLTADETVELGLADSIVRIVGRSRFRASKRQQTFKSPNVNKIKRLIKKLNERVHLPKNLKIDLHAPLEKEEDIEQYDNTETEIKNIIQEPKNPNETK